MFSDIWKGHVLLFEHPLERLANSVAITRFLAAFLLSGVALLWGGRELASRFGGESPLTSRLLLVYGLVALSLVLSRAIVGRYWEHFGLRPPGRWTRREFFYALQVIPIASVVFFYLFRTQIDGMISANGLVGFLVFNLAFGLMWGLFQEFVYRGLLQTALASWCGPILGVLLANVAFTFGPLHASIYADIAQGVAQPIVFAPIFVIGLVFGLIFQRSGNLWLPAIFHGLWPLNMG